MNAICHFRKCTLSDKDLLKKVDELTDAIFITRTLPPRHIPAEPDMDYDLLIGELILRYADLLKDLELINRNLRELHAD